MCDFQKTFFFLTQIVGCLELISLCARRAGSLGLCIPLRCPSQFPLLPGGGGRCCAACPIPGTQVTTCCLRPPSVKRHRLELHSLLDSAYLITSKAQPLSPASQPTVAWPHCSSTALTYTPAVLFPDFGGPFLPCGKISPVVSKRCQSISTTHLHLALKLNLHKAIGD